MITNGYNQETGEKIMNVAPETAKYYGILALLNAIGLPLDIAYLGFLNIAKEGNTQAIAQDKTTQIVAVANVAITAVGTIFGVVFNLVWQLVLWLQDIMNIDLTVTDMWGVLSLTARNFFENIIYEGFKPALLFVPVYSMFAMALPYAIYIYDVNF